MPVSARLVSLRLDGQYIPARNAPSVIEHSVTATVSRGVRRIKPAMEKSLQGVYQSLKKRHGNRWQGTGLFGSHGGPDLKLRSGEGLKSIRDSISVNYDNQMGVVATIDTGTMGVHETGATITPRRGKYLAIPTVYALTSRGNPRTSPGKARNTFFRMTKAGNLFLFRRVKGEAPVPLFLMRTMVGLKARLGLKEAIEAMADAFPDKAAAALMEANR